MVIQPYEPEKEYIMLFKNKKSELTRVECLALNIVLWSIQELLSKKYPKRHVFFSQLSVSTVSLPKLKHIFQTYPGRNYKAIQLEAFFTTHEEDYSPTYRGTEEAYPKVNLEVLFEHHYLWDVSGFNIEIRDYSYNHPYEKYFFEQGRLREGIDVPQFKTDEEKAADKILMEKRERFKTFFTNLYRNTVSPHEVA